MMLWGVDEPESANSKLYIDTELKWITPKERAAASEVCWHVCRHPLTKIKFCYIYGRKCTKYLHGT